MAVPRKTERDMVVKISTNEKNVVKVIFVKKVIFEEGIESEYTEPERKIVGAEVYAELAIPPARLGLIGVLRQIFSYGVEEAIRHIAFHYPFYAEDELSTSVIAGLVRDVLYEIFCGDVDVSINVIWSDGGKGDLVMKAEKLLEILRVL